MEEQLEGGSNGLGISQTRVELRSLLSLRDISTPFILSAWHNLESVKVLRANIPAEKRSGTREK
jgi:hypothetical protein